LGIFLFITHWSAGQYNCNEVYGGITGGADNDKTVRIDLSGSAFDTPFSGIQYSGSTALVPSGLPGGPSQVTAFFFENAEGSYTTDPNVSASPTGTGASTSGVGFSFGGSSQAAASPDGVYVYFTDNTNYYRMRTTPPFTAEWLGGHPGYTPPVPDPGGFGDLVFDADGRCWAVVFGVLYLIDFNESPPSRRALGTIFRTDNGQPQGFEGLAFSPDGRLIGSGNAADGIWEIDLSDMTTTQIIPPGVNDIGDLFSCSFPLLAPEIRFDKVDSVLDNGDGISPGPGDTIEYTLTITNTGNLFATNPVLTEVIPSGTTYVTNSTTVNGTPVPDIGTFMPFTGGATVQSPSSQGGSYLYGGPDQAIVVTYRVTMDADVDSSILNQALIETDETGPVLSDDPDAPGGSDITVTELFVDSDNDGVSDALDQCPGSDDTQDIDADGIPNGCDPDIDGDGNPNGTDPDPTGVTANDDTATVPALSATAIEILQNDHYLPNSDPNNLGTTTLSNTGAGSATGTVAFDNALGVLIYTAPLTEVDTTVVVEYQVCNDASGTDICRLAQVEITVVVPDNDGDGTLDADDPDPNDPCVDDGVEGDEDPSNPIYRNSDCDSDGLIYAEEEAEGTDPYRSDTDGDGISDGQEVNIDGTNPLDSCDSVGGTPLGTDDCDGDGLSEVEESAAGTDPNEADTDGDGIADGQEVSTDGTDPLDSCSSTGGTPLDTADCDGDGLSGNEEAEAGTDPENPDTDGDSIPDGQEVNIDGTDPLDSCDGLGGTPLGTDDCDEDGLSSVEEASAGTDPENPDTDGDGIIDGQEINVDGTNPLDSCDSLGGTPSASSDCDNDGLALSEELAAGTDPEDADTDGDTISDGQEINPDGTDPLDDCSNSGGTPLPDSDCDSDGLDQTEEATAGTDPFDPDTDGDGITDGQEINTDGTDPLDDCSSVGGTPLPSSDCDGDGLSTSEEATAGTDPDNRDTDNDGVDDGQEVITDGTDPLDPCSSAGGSPPADSDCDGDGLSLSEEAVLGTDPNQADTDGDGVSDGQEVNSDGTDPLDECSNIGGTALPTSDCDLDGLTTSEENTLGTDPDDPDTDGDGIPDGQEVNVDQTDPLDACSQIGGVVPGIRDCDEDGLTNDEEETLGTDPYDPDTDGDGAMDSLDGHPLEPTAVNDLFSVTPQESRTIDVLANDDYLPDGHPQNLGSTQLRDTGEGTATGIVTVDAATGTITYLPDLSEINQNVTIIYEVCNTESGMPICRRATVVVVVGVADRDGDGIFDNQEIQDGTDPDNPCSSRGGTPPEGVDCSVVVSTDLVTPQSFGGAFRVHNIGRYPDNTVEIFNRWGVQVYEARGYDNRGTAFRGISEGRVTYSQDKELPAGVYFYTIRYNENGVIRKINGYLYLNR